MLTMLCKVIKILISFILFAILIIVTIYFNNPHSLIYIYVGDDDKTVWLETKYVPFRKVISDTVYYKFSETAQWSPNDRYFSYYDFVGLEWAEKEWALKIVDARFFSTKIIFIGDYHTGQYDWIDDNTIRVCAGAGSGVRRCRNIDIHVKQPIIGVDDYSSGNWTPEKTF